MPKRSILNHEHWRMSLIKLLHRHACKSRWFNTWYQRLWFIHVRRKLSLTKLLHRHAPKSRFETHDSSTIRINMSKRLSLTKLFCAQSWMIWSTIIDDHNSFTQSVTKLLCNLLKSIHIQVIQNSNISMHQQSKFTYKRTLS